MTEEAIVSDTLSTLSALTAALSKASGTLLGRSANSIMYLSGSDMGRAEGQKMDRTADLGRALEMVMQAELRGWRIELWKDADQESTIIREGDVAWAWLVFRDCPVRQVCLAHDVPMGDALCQLGHGYFAGMLSEILGVKAQLALEHAGPNACKMRLQLR